MARKSRKSRAAKQSWAMGKTEPERADSEKPGLPKREEDLDSRTGLAVFLFTIIASSLWALYFTVFHNSVDLGEFQAGPPAAAPGIAKKPEAGAAGGAGGQKAASAQAAPGGGKPARPWLSTDEGIAQGAKVYKIHCAVCHGAGGLGDGTPGLVPPPRNLVEGQWERGGSSKELFVTLRDGMEGSSMVSFKHLSAEDRWALVHYIRSITKNKPEDSLKELEEFAKSAP